MALLRAARTRTSCSGEVVSVYWPFLMKQHQKLTNVRSAFTWPFTTLNPWLVAWGIRSLGRLVTCLSLIHI
mgnify:CR=1 FL=1